MCYLIGRQIDEYRPRGVCFHLSTQENVLALSANAFLFCFIASYFLEEQGAPGSSCTFTTPALQSAIFPRCLVASLGAAARAIAVGTQHT